MKGKSRKTDETFGLNKEKIESSQQAQSSVAQRRIPQPLPTLEMMHTADLVWEGDHPSVHVEIIDDLIIEHTAPEYQHGGQVYRVVFKGEEGFIDCMLCEWRLCRKCNPDANPLTPRRIGGYPFIHASDLTKENGIMNFTPKPRAPTQTRQAQHTCHGRIVRFDSYKACYAEVCGSSTCRVCSGSETRRVQENREIDVANGQTGGSLGNYQQTDGFFLHLS